MILDVHSAIRTRNVFGLSVWWQHNKLNVRRSRVLVVLILHTVRRYDKSYFEQACSAIHTDTRAIPEGFLIF